MAKNTHAQEAATGTSDSYTEDELLDPEPPQHIIITRPILGEVDRAVITEAYDSKAHKDAKEGELLSRVTVDGGDSTLSSPSEQPESDKPNPSLQQPAPTTENPSSPTPEETSGVDSTDGDGQRTAQPPSGKGRQTPPTAARKAAPAKKAAPVKQTGARATMMGAEDGFDDF